MSLRICNIIIAVLLIITSTLTSFQMTVRLISVGPLNGFNLGYLLLPLVLSLSLLSIAGLLVFFINQGFGWVRKSLIGIYGLLVILSLVFGVMIPPLFLFVIIFFLLLYYAWTLQNKRAEQYFLIHNLIILLMNIGILLLTFGELMELLPAPYFG